MLTKFFLGVAALVPLAAVCASPLVASYPMHRSEQLTDSSLVDLLLSRFSMSKEHISQPRVAYWQNHYLKDTYHLRRVLHNMTPFIPLMLKSLDSYGLPGEVALIPVIECCYRTSDISDKGAKGLWQINPITADHLGLADKWDYHSCFDIQRSTQAAMLYLADLHARFGSWPLALAAYNAGPQVVQKSLASQPSRRNNDLEQLNLPEQTKDFVAKIQALAQILQHYDHFGVVLPSQADPLIAITPKLPLDMRDFMLSFQIPLEVLQYYNPALSHYKSPKGMRYSWLLPQSYLKNVNIDYETLLYQTHQRPYYKVQSGDTLSHIAHRFGLSSRDLMLKNELGSTKIFPGQLVQIPALFQIKAPMTIHHVKAGETLWSIARLYGAQWEEVQKVNDLKTESIKPSQQLIIPATAIKKLS